MSQNTTKHSGYTYIKKADLLIPKTAEIFILSCL